MALSLKNVKNLPDKLNLHYIVNNRPIIKVRKEFVLLRCNLLIIEVDGGKLFVFEAVVFFY